MKHLKSLFSELLMVRMIRIVVGKLRFFYYARVLRKVRIQESKHAIDHTVKHNLTGIGCFRVESHGQTDQAGFRG